MMYTGVEIADEEIVSGARSEGIRPTTYDATVGCIIHEGKEIKQKDYVLPPRGIVWVISAETFSLPATVTGLATLRTTWTHEGVLALNVGIVDPLWNGPLAAALVNFSNSNFMIEKGDTFLRLMFHGHEKVSAKPVVRDMMGYKKEILSKSRNFSSTFLNMESLIPEVSEKVFSMPKWAYYLTLVGLIIGAAAIFTPITLSVLTDYRLEAQRMIALENRISMLESSLSERQ